MTGDELLRGLVEELARSLELLRRVGQSTQDALLLTSGTVDVVAGQEKSKSVLADDRDHLQTNPTRAPR